MANGYDGSIRINTQIETKGMTSQMQKIVNSLKSAETEVSRLRGRMKELENTRIPTEEYARLQKELEELIQKQSELNDKMREFDGVSNKAKIPLYKDLYFQIDDVNKKIEFTQQLMKDMETNDRAFLGAGSASKEYAKAAARVQELTGNIKVGEMRLYELRAKQRPVTQEFDRMQKAACGLGKIFGNAGKAAGKAFRGMKDGVHKLLSSLNGDVGRAGGMLSTLQSRLKGIALSLLIFNWITKGFNAMASGMKQGFESLANYSDSYADSIQGLKNAQTTLGNSFAAAFAPIVQIAIPYLVELINWINRAVNSLSQLFALLCGKNTWTKAVQAQTGYHDALDDTAAAAKKAYGALAKFDDLDALQKREDNTAGSGMGAVGDSFKEVPVSDEMKNLFDWLKDMWEAADFYELGKLIGEKLKEALENIPWDEIKAAARKLGKSLATLINGFIEVEDLGYMIGYTLAQAFNTAFEFLSLFVHKLHWESIGKFIAETISGFFNSIDWMLIYDTFITGAKGLGDAINSFVDHFDWSTISATISNFVNTYVDTWFAFLDTVEWSVIGDKVGQQITLSLAKMSFSGIGKTAAEAINSAFNFLDSIGDRLDWSNLGRSIAEGLNSFFRSFDLKSLSRTLNAWAKGLMNAMLNAMRNTDWKGIGNKIGNFLSEIDFGEIAEKVVKTLWEAIRSALDAWNGLFDATPIEAAIVAAFGAMKLADVAKPIIQQLSGVTRAFELSTEAISGNGNAAAILAASYPSLAKGLSNVYNVYSAFNDTLRVSNDVFASLGAAIDAFQDSLTGIQKGVIGAAAAFLEFNFVKDNIEQIILGTDNLADALAQMGVAVAAAGAAFSLILGFPAGLIATGVIGLVAAIAGIDSAFKEIEAVSAMDAVGEALRNPGGTPLSEITESYQAMVAGIGESFDAINAKSAELENTKQNVKETSQSIDLIKFALENGSSAAEETIPELQQLFSDLLNDSKNIFDQEYDVIMTGISGSLGQALIDAGYSVEQIVGLMDDLKTSHQKSIDEIVAKNAELESSYANGEISTEQYTTALMENYGKLSEITGKTDEYSAAISKVADAAGGVDLSQFINNDNTVNTAALAEQFDKLGETAAGAKESIYSSSDSLVEALKDYETEALRVGDSEAATAVSDMLSAEAENVSVAVTGVDAAITQYGDTIQTGILEKIPGVVDEALADYENRSWLYKLTHTEAEHVQGALDEYQTSVIDPVSQQLEEMYSNMGVEGTSWASDAAKTIVDGLFDTTVEQSYEGVEITTTALRDNYRSIVEGATEGIGKLAEERAKDVADGFNTGILNNTGSSENAVKQWQEAVNTAIHDSVMKYGSPSQTAKDYGKDTVEGFNIGIAENMASTLEIIAEWMESAKLAFAPEQWESIFANILPAFQMKWTELTEWWIDTAVPEFLAVNTESLFSMNNWLLVFDNILIALQQKWMELTAWWDGEALPVWWNGSVSVWFSWEKWYEKFNNIWLALKQRWGDITKWWNDEALPLWWKNSVSVWFSQEKWYEKFNNIWLALRQRWEDIVKWWDGEALPQWWGSSVSVWFSLEKWLELLENVREAFELTWKAIEELIEQETNDILKNMEQKQTTMSAQWQETMGEMEDSSRSAFQNIRSDAETAISAVMSMIEELSAALSALEERLNSIGSRMSSVSSSGSYGRYSAQEVSAYSMPEIPALASGAVIRGGSPFVALLGDQPAGQTNIEAPLPTIRQAVREELSGMNFGGGQMKVVLQVNGSDLAFATLNDFLSEANRQGYDVDVLGWQG